jgi:hypothetical protein
LPEEKGKEEEEEKGKKEEEKEEKGREKDEKEEEVYGSSVRPWTPASSTLPHPTRCPNPRRRPSIH